MIDDSLVKNTELTRRTVKCLLANGIDTEAKLKAMNLEEFRRRKSIGKKTMVELLKYLQPDVYKKLKQREVIKNRLENFESATVGPDVGLDEKVYNTELKSLNLSAKLGDKLKKLDMKTIGDFLENVYYLSPDEINLVYESLKPYDIHSNRHYVPLHIEKPQNYFLKISEVFLDKWIIDACKKHNLKNIASLVNALPDVFKNDESLAEQEVFADKMRLIDKKLREIGIKKMHINMACFNEKELTNMSIKELIKTNHLETLENCVKNILVASSEENRDKKLSKLILRKKELDIVERRFMLKGKKQTLDKIGQIYGCSRERIRQIKNNVVSRIISAITSDFLNLNYEVGRLLDDFGSVIYYSKNTDFATKELLKEVIANIENRCFDIDFDNYLIVKRGFKTNEIFVKTLKALNTQTQIQYDEIKKVFGNVLSSYLKNDSAEQKNNYSKVFENLLAKFIKEDFMQIDETLYNRVVRAGKQSSKEKDQKMLYWFEKYYPQGVHLPIERSKEERVRKTLQLLLEKCPERDGKAMRYIVSKIKNFKDIIWWGRGLYIHVNNINVDWSAVDFAIDEVIKLFDEGLYRIKPRAVYLKNKEKFLKANIPNELALVGLIKYKNNPRIDIHRDQLREKGNPNINMSILDAFENFILSYPNGINNKEIEHELCYKRGWTSYQIDFLMARSKNVYYEDGIYRHRANEVPV